MDYAHIDYETRSRQDIKKVGAHRYAEDPSTQIWCLFYRINSGDLKYWRPFDDDPEELLSLVRKGGIIKGHNIAFERAIWNTICVPEFDWPKLTIEQTRCTAAKAAALALPRALGDVGNVLELSKVKDDEGHRVMLQMAKPRKPSKLNPKEWYDDSERLSKLFSYCGDDVLSEEAVDNRIIDLKKSEQELWILDQRINDRGVHVDMEAVNAALELLADYKTKLNDRLAEITGGVVTRATQTARLKDWMQEKGVVMPNMQATTVDDWVAKGKLPDDVLEALRIRQKLNKSSTGKYDAIKRSVCKDGRVHELVMFHGASTGRWSGKRVQTQNLPKGIIKDMDSAVELIKGKCLDSIESEIGELMSVLSSAVRGMFVAAPGKDLLVADYAAIEARVLFWHAYEEKGLDIFRQGEDIYKDMASDIYDVLISEINKEQRAMGKQAILGLGYQMWYEKFMATCEKYGIEIEEEFAKQVVLSYRNKYRGVTGLWKAAEDCAIEAVQNKGQTVICGRNQWRYIDEFLFCKLPSKRCLAYYKPMVDEVMKYDKPAWALSYMGIDSTKGSQKWERVSTYGGKLTENIVQATARDLLAHALKKCEEKGYPVVFHVHDEIVAEVPEGFGSVEEFEAILEDTPKWAEGCPIAAEGWRGKRYRK